MNVSSIDFDWIMYPTIEAYNSISNGSSPLGPYDIWKQVEHSLPGFEPRCDLNRFTDLFFLLKNVCKDLRPEDCCVSPNHDDLYKFLKNIGAKKYNLVNIDHHHDLGYGVRDCPLETQPTSVANWAHFAHTELNMYKYTWIRNPNSWMPEEVPESLKFVQTTDLNVIEGMKFDKVFICASWEWVPPKFQNLFAILTSLVDDK